jgi:hypothetical protein
MGRREAFSPTTGRMPSNADMIARLLPTAASLLLIACATSSDRQPVEGPVALGATAFVGGPKVTPQQIVEDSRCPMNARCVWAGRVIVRTTVTLGSGDQTVDLTLGEPTQVADGTLTLVSVAPERMTGQTPSPADYRFAFEFAGGL